MIWRSGSAHSFLLQSWLELFINQYMIYSTRSQFKKVLALFFNTVTSYIYTLSSAIVEQMDPSPGPQESGAQQQTLSSFFILGKR